MKKFLSRFDGGYAPGSWGLGSTVYTNCLRCFDITVGPFYVSVYYGGLNDTIDLSEMDQ